MATQEKTSAFFPFDNSYAQLPERFFARHDPSPVREPRLIKLNEALAQDLNLDVQQLSSSDGISILAGNTVPDGADPIAMAYAGHQFGNWVPQLGDGRAILLGEVTGRDGVRRDIQLKGAGQTPFSRMGDGRAWLGPVLREYIVSEAMAALGIPTTRALAAVATGEEVLRERVLPGAVLTRVAQSHVRVGTFQFFAARDDQEALKLLADYVIERHYPDAAGQAEPYLALLESVTNRQAHLIAQWQLVGFIHGVMNTDNMSVAGETIDYGPCAFMDSYHPKTVYSSIDQMGRYAYVNQPGIAQWNLAVLAQCLLPLISDNEDEAVEKAQAVINGFPAKFRENYLAGMGAKLGLDSPQEDDNALIEDMLERLTAGKADFTLFFRRLCDVPISGECPESLASLFEDASAIEPWLERWRARLQTEQRGDDDRQSSMRQVNPSVIARNHLVEAAIQNAAANDDFSTFEALVEVLSAPFEDRPAGDRFTLPPKPEEVVHQTFCGT